MRASLLLAFLLAWTAFAQAPDEHARKIQDIRKLVLITGGDKLANQAFEQITQQLNATGNPSAGEMLQQFRKEFDFNKVIDLMVESYDRHLTHDDIKSIIAFYESPGGKKLIQELPGIMQETMGQTMKMAQEASERIMKRMQEGNPPKKEDKQ